MVLEYLSSFQASAYGVNALQLFRGVDGAVAAQALSDCAVMRMAAGQTFEEAASKPANLYVLLRGALSVVAEPPGGGDEGESINVLPGECIGEMAMFDEQVAAPTMVAMQDSELLVIEAVRLWRIIDEINGVARNLLHLLSFRIQATNARLRQRRHLGRFYEQMSMTDALTGLHNRAWLDENLPLMIGNAGAAVRPLSLVMLDLDHFKRFNDEHGHLMGDDALRAAARVFAEALRPTDFAVRFGGEEFLVILPGADRNTGRMVAQRLCARMRETVVFEDMRLPLPHITGSFGVATLAAGQNAEALMACADEALYRAKQGGRNCVAE